MIPLDTLFAPVRSLAEGIRAGRIDPVQLAEAYLERLESIGPRLGAVVTVTRERALREARQARDELQAGRYRGPLHGVPYGAKDLIAAAGYPTTWGAAPFREQRFEQDATVVARLRSAGAVLVAKLATVELAGGMGYGAAEASFTGPTRTPWNPDFWAGGSSSGPGSAVAAGLVPFAIGSETWGSIVTPAAFSGVTGLRPTYGRISRHGAMALAWSLDKIGPLCRTADDCGLVLAATAGFDAEDAASVDRPYQYGGPDSPHRRPFRVGVLRGVTEGVQPEVRRNFQQTLEALGGVVELVPEVVLPKYPYNAAIGMIVDAEAASIFEELVESGRIHQLQDPDDRIGGYAGQWVLARDYLKAQRIRTPAGRDLDRLFADGGFDALAHPTRATVAYPVGKRFREAYTEVRGGGEPISGAGNLLGLPALALPNGFGQSGLPTSVTFTGRAWEENRLLDLGSEFQRRTDWHLRRPPVGGS